MYGGALSWRDNEKSELALLRKSAPMCLERVRSNIDGHYRAFLCQQPHQLAICVQQF